MRTCCSSPLPPADPDDALPDTLWLWAAVAAGDADKARAFLHLLQRVFAAPDKDHGQQNHGRVKLAGTHGLCVL